MASLTENTSRIANANENIKTSLLNKGAEFLEGDKIDTYSSKIDSLNVIQPGNYNVECYIRIDDVLVGDGIEFNVVGTDGTTQTATSRAAGFIYLTLNYGVGYDIQPVDTEKYYANSHELIYHIKEDGNYFAADYCFYTAGTGEVFEIKNCDYLFYRNGSYNNFCWSDFDNIIKKIKQPTSAYRMYFQDGNGSSYWYVSLSIIQQIVNLDFSKCTSISYLLDDFGINASDINKTLTVNMDLSSCTNMSYAFRGINYGYSTGYMLNIEFDFNGTTGNVKNFSYCFSNIIPNQTTFKLFNINMDNATNVSNIFTNTNYGNSLSKLTFSGSFGGLSTTTSLTLDLSTCTLLTIDSFLETMQTISVNTNGKTRIIKLSSSLYNSLTDEILDLADEKGYTLASA